MGHIGKIIDKAKRDPKTIVLPESGDERVLRAAGRISRERIAEIILLKEDTAPLPADLTTAKAVNPGNYEKLHLLVEEYKSRERAGISEEDAVKTLKEDPILFSAYMVRSGIAASFVAGATYSTRDVIRTSIRTFGVNRREKTVFGLFLVITQDKRLGEEGLFIFADCAAIPLPNARQLASIAASSADIMKRLFDAEPRVAFLSYSSHGSAEGESIDRMREAQSILKEKRPDILSDGELQLDAAVIPQVQSLKAPESPLKGRANILIFPDLNSANITYKAIERFGGGRAVGPVLMGLNNICSDLSRGVNTEDIVATVALTSVLVQRTL